MIIASFVTAYYAYAYTIRKCIYCNIIAYNICIIFVHMHYLGHIACYHWTLFFVRELFYCSPLSTKSPINILCTKFIFTISRLFILFSYICKHLNVISWWQSREQQAVWGPVHLPLQSLVFCSCRPPPRTSAVSLALTQLFAPRPSTWSVIATNPMWGQYSRSENLLYLSYCIFSWKSLDRALHFLFHLVNHPVNLGKLYST